MDKQAAKVASFIKKYDMIHPKDHLVVGVSGGADSICLLRMLLDLVNVFDFSLSAVHVNHGLRGDSAAADARYVEEICSRWQVPLRIVHADVRAKSQADGISLEEAGRLIRYRIFEEEARGGKIALAHHKNDLAETMLHHMARGTGLDGMAGIRPVNGSRIRPLLCLGRTEIEAWLLDRGISWRTDASNLDDTYTRNRIRHHVLPVLEEEVNPKTLDHMAELSQELVETQELLDMWTGRVEENYCRKILHGAQGVFVEEGLKEEPELIRRRLYLRLCKKISGRQKDFSRRHLESVDELWNRQVGRHINLPGGLSATRRYDGICLQEQGNEPAHEQTHEQEIPLAIPGMVTAGKWQITTEILTDNFSGIRENSYTKLLDYDKIITALCIRKRRPKDRIALFANGQGKKLKDYLIDRKIPAEERDHLYLLAQEEQVLWILGDRKSSLYPVTSQTKRALRITIEGGTNHER